MTLSIFGIVNYESGDTWNGTHGRILKISPLKTGFRITSHNAMCEESRHIDVTKDQLAAALKDPEMPKAKYAADFYRQAAPYLG